MGLLIPIFNLGYYHDYDCSAVFPYRATLYLFVQPVLILFELFCYIQILRTVRSTSQLMKNQTSDGSSLNYAHKQLLTKTLQYLAISIILVVPYTIAWLVETYAPNSPAVFPLTICLILTQVCVCAFVLLCFCFLCFCAFFFYFIF